jgi:excisionase family DNA binding protein
MVATTTPDLSTLLSVHQVAEMLGCSPRHVFRLSDRGEMPAPVKLGALVRWPKLALVEWIASGCPSCPEGGRQ